jgi:K319-like protein/WD40 repeat protein
MRHLCRGLPMALALTVFTGCGDSEDEPIGPVLTPESYQLVAPPSSSLRGPERIAFSSDQGGGFNIWTVAADGSDLQQVTSSPCSETHPHWSSDGSQIAYTNWCDGVHVMSADGSGDVLLPNTSRKVGALGPDFVMDWGPCNVLLLSTEEPSDGVGAIHQISTDGSARRMLTDGRDGDHPAGGWSSDCTAFTWSEGTPFLGGSSRVKVSPVSTLLPVEVFPPDSHPSEWSSDGNWILLTSRGYLWRVHPDGSDATRLAACRCQGADASFLSDGHTIVFLVASEGTLYLTDMDGAPPIPLVSSMGRVMSPDAGPSVPRSPTANAGADQIVDCMDNAGGTRVRLDGSGSSDPDGTVVGWEWREGTVLLGSGQSLDTTLGQGSHTITLTVTDDDGLTHSDDLVVDVVDNTPPVVTAALVPVQGKSLKHDQGRFRVEFRCLDGCDPQATPTAFLNGVAVANGQVVNLRVTRERSKERNKSGKSPKSDKSNRSGKLLTLAGPSFVLVVECVDVQSNVGRATAIAEFPERKGGKS